MDVGKLFKRLAIGASVLGLVESIAYIVLSILGILLSKCMLTIDDGQTYQQISLKAMVFLYFNDCFYRPELKIMSSGGMLTYCCLYLVFNFFWFITSLVLIVFAFGVMKGQLRGGLIFWGIITEAVCILDFSTMIVFGIDYNTISELYNPEPYLTQGILNFMLIGSKGFALWLINLILAVVILVVAIRNKNQVDQDRMLNLSTSRSFTGPWVHSREPLWNSGPDSNDSYHVPAVLSKGVDGPNQQPTSMIQSPTVGEMPRSPWLFENNRSTAPPMFNNYNPPRTTAVSVPPPPPLPSHKPVQRRYIPEPDYSPPVRRSFLGAYNQANRNPINSGLQEEPPLRSALKKSHSHHGRTVF